MQEESMIAEMTRLQFDEMARELFEACHEAAGHNIPCCFKENSYGNYGRSCTADIGSIDTQTAWEGNSYYISNLMPKKDNEEIMRAVKNRIRKAIRKKEGE